MTESLQTLSRKRAFRRGRLTTLKKCIDEARDNDLREQSIRSLSYLRASITEEIEMHEAYQGEYESLLSREVEGKEADTSLETELESGVEYKSIHAGYLRTLDALIEEVELFQESMHLEQDYSEWSELADVTARLFLEESQKYSQKFSDYLAKTQPLTTSEVITSCRSRIRSASSRLRKLTNEVKEKAPTSRIESTPTERTTYHHKIEIELPSFSGDPTEWSHYHHLFTTTLSRRGKDLSSVEKCCLLLKSLKDPKAKRIAQLNSEVSESYEEAMKALVERYGQPQIQLPLLIAKLKTRETFAYTQEGMLQSGDVFIQTYKSLLHMDIDLTTFMAAYASSHFGEKYAEEWRRFTATLSSLPTCEDLYGFIQSTVSRMPPDLKSSSDLKSSPPQKQTKFSSSKPKQESKPKSFMCVLCGEASHALARCPTFLEHPPEKRGKIVKEKKWCNNCLHPAHTSQHCTSAFTCRHCGGKHHTLLHRGADSSTSNNQPATSTTTFMSTLKGQSSNPKGADDIGGPPNHSFINTAMATAFHGGRSRISRIALDTGSSTSLITETLATQLRLKRYPQRLSLSGAYSEGTSTSYVQVSLASLHDPGDQTTLKMSVVAKLPHTTPPLRSLDILSDADVRSLQLADSQFGGPLDILLGCADVFWCHRGESKHIPEPNIIATPTLFGWTISGHLDPGQCSKFLSIQTTEDELKDTLQFLWNMEQLPTTSHHSEADISALDQFEKTHSRDETGRYSVSLPRVVSPPELGTSKPSAICRFHQNEKSLRKKSRLSEFEASLTEYSTLQHAEPVPTSQIDLPSYYLPVHGVFKSTSSTTKVRPVFDASAKTSNGNSLNDLLLAGPNLYPLLTDIIIRFRTHLIGFSADISKMFREILLNEGERDFHRFVMRNDQGRLIDYRMRRLTFGVKSSPFLATKVLHDLAEKNSSTHPIASNAILTEFYVDDFLSGADTVDEATSIREQLCDLLASAGMTLRKWRSSSQEFTNSIPENLREQTDLSIKDTPKALGIHWDVHKDQLIISTPVIPTNQTVTKRFIASQSAKVYDLLGLFAPFLVRSKLILQKLWKTGCDWDEEVAEDIKVLWNEWAMELPFIHNHPIQRRYHMSTSPVVHRSLHGFADASTIAYGAVVYLRLLHSDGSITTSIVIAKARVAPLKSMTIPRAELVAAHLLSKLLIYAANLLDIPFTDLHPWTDSMIVLCWLRKSPSSLQLFVANRVAAIQTSLPEVTWRHVSTRENPADLLSRGVSSSTLSEASFWWEGPKWISQTPTSWNAQEHLQQSLPKKVPEQKIAVLTIIASDSANADWNLWSKFSSFHLLTKVLAWIKRFIYNSARKEKDRDLSTNLQIKEIKQSRIYLLKESQQETYPNLIKALRQKKPLPKNHPLSKFNVHLDDQGLLLVSGRVRVAKHRNPKQAIILSTKSIIVKSFLYNQHVIHHHPGVAALMAIINETYYVPGLKSYLKQVSHSCAICQKAYARTLQPPMGLLPPERTTPTPPFKVTGIDFAGPITIKKGHTRKPVLIKTYICLFVCFSTKAIHLELCSDLTTEAFQAALLRFCSRRGCPTDIHSDNGTNFVGAANELRQVEHLMASARSNPSSLSTSNEINWHFTPPRSPNFGGLWEAGVRQMKVLLRKQITPHPLTFEELSTILYSVEAILNSRPLTPLDATELSEDLVITPGHFLIGRPIESPPSPAPSDHNISYLKRWNLVKRLQQDLWLTWQSWYLQTLSQRSKWHLRSRDVNIGDIVLLKDESVSPSTNKWPMARIAYLHKGDDGISRAADIVCQGKTYKRALSRFIPLFSKQ